MRLIEFAWLAVLCGDDIVCSSFCTMRYLDLYKMYTAYYVFANVVFFKTLSCYERTPSYDTIYMDGFSKTGFIDLTVWFEFTRQQRNYNYIKTQTRNSKVITINFLLYVVSMSVRY